MESRKLENQNPQLHSGLGELSQPWLITPAWIPALISAALDPERYSALSVKAGIENRPAGNLEDRNGVAVIRIEGPVLRYGSFFSALFRSTVIEDLAKEFREAVDDPEVKTILLNIDSPGGEVNGVHEMGEMIYRARSKKRIVAYVGGSACSAAYWLASAADEIVVDATAQVGSIGVVAIYRDRRKAMEKIGIRDIEIISTASPKKMPDPATDTGQAQIRNHIDAIADVFIVAVARNRRKSESVVRTDFGRGDVMIGARGVVAGLVDRLGSFRGILSELKKNDKRGSSMQTKASQKNNSFPTPVTGSTKPVKATRQEKQNTGVRTAVKSGDAERELKNIERLARLANAHVQRGGNYTEESESGHSPAPRTDNRATVKPSHKAGVQTDKVQANIDRLSRMANASVKEEYFDPEEPVDEENDLDGEVDQMDGYTDKEKATIKRLARKGNAYMKSCPV